MKAVLSVDSSGKAACVCILQNGVVLHQGVLNAGLTHSETLLGLVQAALMQTGLSMQNIGLLAVTKGPGSFTGLRIGMALVKGLALPFATPALGISTLKALAMAYYMQHSTKKCILVPALNARRGEVYWAAFSTVDGFKRLSGDAVGPADGLAQKLQLAGEDILFLGEAAQICYNQYALCKAVQKTEETLSPALGAAVLAGQLWAQGGQLPGAAQLRPQYLRLSQAQRLRAAALGQASRQ